MPLREDEVVSRAALEKRLVSAAQLEECLRTQRQSPTPVTIAKLLVEKGYITAEQAAQLAPPPPPAPKLLEGEKYDVRGEIAEGGMGRILDAYDRHLKRHVAMKVMRSPEETTAEELVRFVEEAQATAQLEHPNIVPTHEVGLDPAGRLYFTMKLVQGQSLRQILEKRAVTTTRLLQAFQQVCYAVSYAHSKGVIHRDLKPENVMLGEFGEVFVMDWGLAKVMATTETPRPVVRTVRSEEDSTRTLDGTIVGTPQYMAPEQAEGKLAEIDARTDVYALGAILYEILAGQKPVDGGTVVDILENVIAGRIRPFAKRVPKELRAIALKAMSRAKEDRYPTALALAEDLQACFEGRRGLAWRDTPLTLTAKWIGRHRALSVVAAVALVAVSGLVAWFYTRPGTLTLVTNPEGAEVWIDGEPAGRSPILHLKLGAGRHTVTLRADEYDDAVHEVSIGRGSAAEHTFTLFWRRQVVTISSEPAGADVEIGELRGKTPFTRELPRGGYAAALSKDGFVPQERFFEVRGGGTLISIEARLESDTGSISIGASQPGLTAKVLSPEGAEILKPFALPKADIVLKRGEYRLLIDGENRIGREFPLSVRRGGREELLVALSHRRLWTEAVETQGGPTIADLDGDGVMDVIVPGKSTTAFRGVDGTRLWTSEASRRVIAADCNGDKVPDAVVLGMKKETVALDGRNGAVLWRRSSTVHDIALIRGVQPLLAEVDVGLIVRRLSDGEVSWTLPHVSVSPDPALSVDVNGDGQEDLVLALPPGDLVALDGATGRVLWKLPRVGVFMGAAPLGRDRLLAMVNGAEALLLERSTGLVTGRWGLPEVTVSAPVCVSGGALVRGTSAIHFFGADGTPRWKREMPYMILCLPAVADFDGDGEPEAALGLSDGRVLVLSMKTGETVWEVRLPGPSIGSPSAADFDRDGIPDLVLGTDAGVHVWSGGRGRVEWICSPGTRLTDARLADGMLALACENRIELYDPARATRRAATAGFSVWNGSVLVAESGRLEARDMMDGTFRWSVPYEHAFPRVLPSRRILVAQTARGLIVMGPAGRVLWTVPFAVPVAVAGNDDVFVTTPAQTRLLSGTDGSALWSAEGDLRMAAAARGRACLAYGSRLVWCDSRTGREIARAEVPHIVKAIAAAGDHWLVAHLAGLAAFTSEGAPVWKGESVRALGSTDMDGDGIEEGISVSDDGRVTAFVAADGRPLWTTSALPPGELQLGSTGPTTVVWHRAGHAAGIRTRIVGGASTWIGGRDRQYTR